MAEEKEADRRKKSATEGTTDESFDESVGPVGPAGRCDMVVFMWEECPPS